VNGGTSSLCWVSIFAQAEFLCIRLRVGGSSDALFFADGPNRYFKS